MSEIQTSAIKFDSANGQNCVAAYYYDDGSNKPRAVVQISHGMCEYIERYKEFAAFLVEHGFAVCGNDHLGHGGTSAGGTDGFFAEKNGWQFVLEDIHTMNRLAAERYPGCPIFLLGHSMGSFFARLYAATYPETIHALVLSGTGGPNPFAGVGVFLTDLLSRWKGPKHRSQWINRLAFGSYLSKIPNPATPYDWITRDAEIVKAYAADPKCTFVFTVSAFHDLMQTLKKVSTAEWAQKIPKAMPVALFSGDKDPVGDYGKGVVKVYEMLCNAGVQDVTLKLYEDGRHEMLNEINRQEVYRDILNWCNTHL